MLRSFEIPKFAVLFCVPGRFGTRCQWPTNHSAAPPVTGYGRFSVILLEDDNGITKCVQDIGCCLLHTEMIVETQ